MVNAAPQTYYTSGNLHMTTRADWLMRTAPTGFRNPPQVCAELSATARSEAPQQLLTSWGFAVNITLYAEHNKSP